MVNIKIDSFVPNRLLIEVGRKSCTTSPETLTREIRVAKRRWKYIKKKKQPKFRSEKHQGHIHQTHDLWRINNWLRIWICFNASLKIPVSHPTSTLVCTSHIDHLLQHLLQPPSSHLLLFNLPLCSVWRMCAGCLKNRSLGKLNSLFKSLHWPSGPRLNADLQQITGAVWSSLLLDKLYHWGAGSPSVCLQSKQFCGWCSQCWIELDPPSPQQTWELCKGLFCGLQFGLQYHHAKFSLSKTDPALCAHFKSISGSVRLGKLTSKTLSISTGDPQRCIGVIGFLGSTISQDLKWDNLIEIHWEKGPAEVVLFSPAEFNLPQELLIQFYSLSLSCVHL